MVKRFFANVGLFTVCVVGLFGVYLYQQSTWKIPFFALGVNTDRQPVKTLDLRTLDPKIKEAVETAQATALNHARGQLEVWHAEIMQKVDQNFLDWYFGYWNQQRLGVSYTFTKSKNWVKGFFIEVEENAAEKELMAEVSREFEKRVIPRPILQQKFEQIASETVTAFADALRGRLNALPLEYNIPQPAWDMRLEAITVMVADTEGNRSQSLSLKALTAGVVVGVQGSLPVINMMIPAIKATIAQAGLGQAVASSGSLGVDPVVTVILVAGLVAWEAWDHQKTVEENRPLLRANIDTYLQDYEKGLLKNDGMIGSVLYSLTNEITTKVAMGGVG